MERALSLAALGLYTSDPNPRVGCILVRDGRIVGEGWHERAGQAHAEVAALAAAGVDARGATAYVTLEPCSHHGRTPPCADALIGAGIRRVVCASIDPNPRVAGAGVERLEGAGIAVTVGPRSAEARALNVGFFSRFERGRPWIRLKLAMSLDARTAPAGGGRMWISGESSRADVQQWRARSSAILTGAGTVRIDDPRLDVRLEYGPWVRQPLKVVLDPALSCPATAQVFRDGRTLVFATEHASRSHSEPVPPTVLEERVPAAGRRLDPRGGRRAAGHFGGQRAPGRVRPDARRGVHRGPPGRRAHPVRRTGAARRGCGAAHRAHGSARRRSCGGGIRDSSAPNAWVPTCV